MVSFSPSHVLPVCTVTCWIMFSFDLVDSPQLTCEGTVTHTAVKSAVTEKAITVFTSVQFEYLEFLKAITYNISNKGKHSICPA